MKNAATIQLKTTTLGTILKRANAPTFIHYLSVDIEGGEYEALKNFPFNRYKIGAITVEHNFEKEKRIKLASLLKAHGFTLKRSIVQDDWYINEENIRKILESS